MTPRFALRQLDAFVAAAEVGSFTLAAQRLNLTASAISNQISELESGLGFSLFARTTRRMVLTAEGREFLPAALAMQRQVAATALVAADVRNRAVDVVRVAAPLSIAANALPRLIASFREHRPTTQVRVLDTGVEWLSDRVATGEADLALGPDRIANPEVKVIHLFASPWVVWCTPEHPLAALSPLRWTDLVPWDFYAAGRDHEHSVYPRLAGLEAARVTPVQVVQNITTALGMAAAGLGFTCSPAYLQHLAEREGLVLCPLTDPEITRWMALYVPSDRKPSAATAGFLEHVRGSWTDASALNCYAASDWRAASLQKSADGG